MPYERYRRDLQREGFQHDPAQERAILYLQKIYEQLLAQPEPVVAQKPGLFTRLLGRNIATAASNAALARPTHNFCSNSRGRVRNLIGVLNRMTVGTTPSSTI